MCEREGAVEELVDAFRPNHHGMRSGCLTWGIIIVIAFVVVFVLAGMLASVFQDDCPPNDANCQRSSVGYVGGYRGGGTYFGGK